MRIYLAKVLDDMKKYGPTYDLTMETEERVESTVFGSEESAWMLENLVDEINAICGTLLDDGDYDFIDAEKCGELKNYLSEYDMDGASANVTKMMLELVDYLSRAIQYDTGIAIEL